MANRTLLTLGHDLNNMLAAINGLAELLLRPTSELGQRERRQVEQIKAAGERAATLMRAGRSKVEE